MREAAGSLAADSLSPVVSRPAIPNVTIVGLSSRKGSMKVL
jgi:hypothetical protein